MKGLTDIPGIRVGHASDYEGLTGCTVVLCEAGAVAGVDIRGGGTGTEEMDVMSPLHVTGRVHAVVLAGGSAFGLEAASGVRRFLEGRGVGFPTGAAVVPIVPAAILYDLAIGKASARPTREMGAAAAAVATDAAVKEGNVGAGTGATCGKILGMKHAMKSGIGTATVDVNGVLVSALVAVNAFGDVREPETGRIVAGARQTAEGREFANSTALMLGGRAGGWPARQNTTLVVVATSAALTKPQATRVAQNSHLGMARTISPVHTSMDGDLCIALSLGDKKASADVIGAAAAEAVAQAILRAVRSAATLGGIPGLAG